MRLIDADAVLERIERDCDARCPYKDYKEPLRSKMCKSCELGDARMYVEDGLTVDAEPIRHGHLISDRLCSTNGGTYGVRRCSNCEYYCNDYGDEWNYCPHCGAKMDAKGEDDAD